MNNKWLCIALLAVFTTAHAAEPRKIEENRLGVGKVKVNPSLAKAVDRSNSTLELGRVVEAMDSQLIDRLHNTRKFQVVARSDLAEIIGEQELASSGNIDTNDSNAAQSFKLAGCKYLLVTTVDNFQDDIRTANFEAIGERVTKRTLRFSAVGKIIDTTTGVARETTNFQISEKDMDDVPAWVDAKRDELPQEVLTVIARRMADQMANRVVDAVFPAKIVGMSDKTVTINRGDGTGVAVDQVWDVYAPGEEMIDPDTKQSLGRHEVRVGAVRITSVEPLFAKADVIEDLGVDKLQICRMHRDKK